MEAAVINRSKRTVLAVNARVADSFLSRARGLMFKQGLEDGEGLVLVTPPTDNRWRCCIHTFFMRFPIDVLFVREGEVVDLVEGLKPWRFYVPDEPAEIIVELPEGTVESTGTEVGDRIDVVKGSLDSELAVRILNRKLVTRKLANAIMSALVKSGLQGEVYYNKDTGCIHIAGEDKYIVADTIKEVFGDAVEVIEGRAKMLTDDHSLVVIVKDAHSVMKQLGQVKPARKLVHRQEPKPVRWGRSRGGKGTDESGGKTEEGGGSAEGRGSDDNRRERGGNGRSSGGNE